MKKYKIVIEKTTPENSSPSWANNMDALIKEYPVTMSITGIGGGAFESIEKANEWLKHIPTKYTLRKYTPDFVPNSFGTWELSAYTEKEAQKYWGELNK